MIKVPFKSTLIDIPVSAERVARYKLKAETALAERGVGYVLEELAYLGALVESMHNRVRTLESVFDLVGTPERWDETQPESFPDSVKVLAEMVLDPDDGFHKLDHDSAGKPYRWTGPDNDFVFYLNLNRSTTRDGHLKLAAFSKDYAKGIRCFVDGHLVPCDHTLADGSLVYNFTLPPTAHAHTTNVRFSVPKLWHPKDRNPESKDDRRLGVAFQELSISAAA